MTRSKKHLVMYSGAHAPSEGRERSEPAGEGAGADMRRAGRGSRDPLPERSEGDVTHSGLSRRAFLGFTGATAALGLSGCIRRPVENILPFTEMPEYRVPGIPLHYATVTERRGDAIGLLVTSHDGRPTKIEGNPNHPVSRGAADVFAQAWVMNLYDPDRSTSPARSKGGKLADATWAEADKMLAALVDTHTKDGGRGLRLLVRPTNSPSVRRMRDQLAARFPEAKLHQYTATGDTHARDGAKLAFGRDVNVVYDLERANVILALDSDFLVTEPGAMRNARGFAARRRPTSPKEEMSRLYVVEGTYSVTGANADHRLRLPSSQVEAYLRAIAGELAAKHGADLGGLGGKAPAGVPAKWVAEVAAELAGNRGAAPIVVGERQPARVHALAHALNEALGNIGLSVQPVTTDAVDEGDIATLAADLKGGKVDTLLILGGNPVYDAPADLDVAGLLATEGLTSVHLSTNRDETSQLCTWHLPDTHELEAWGDQKALDGTVAVQQPLIAPLYQGRSELELTAMLAGERNWRGHAVVRATQRRNGPITSAFEAAWRQTLHGGVVAGSTTVPLAGATVRKDEVATALGSAPAQAAPGKGNLEVVFALDYAMYDGRFGNNPWMLELPHPLTKVVWDNAALLSPATAREIGVETGDVVKLSRKGAKDIEIAVLVLPGHADWVVTLPLGWGRPGAGRYGNGAGFDVYPMRTSDGFWFAGGVTAQKTGTHELVTSQHHGEMEGRPLAVDATLEPVQTNDPRYANTPAYAKQPQFAAYASVLPTTGPLWEEVDYSDSYKWGMTIDLSSCTGCNACVVACQSENNIPVVGKREAAVGRTMHWIRIDRYYVGGEDDEEPLMALQPVACQQCEEAPCENVCPVGATTHSPDGLNDMAYNRCVGTRYCMNNCPYKVRRFNYLNWNGYLDSHTANYGEIPETHKMQKNPNVTVRFRGVMEKCTYCVQRIEEAKKAAMKEKRRIRANSFTTACAATCPSNAIFFGDLNDPEWKVTRWATVDRSYKLLAEIGTQPRTTFLGKIRNPNPAMLRAGATEGT